jgi:virulence factor Mce-like protein
VNKRAPKKSQLTLMILFAFSCFAILLYLWTAFGGPTPLTAREYQIVADFKEATQLSDTADVRISGVSIGRVRKTEAHGNRTRVTIQIKPEYAPLPTDTKAILRLKTLLGETYIELTPGSKQSKPLPDGGQLPTSQIAETVELDEILRAFDAETRKGMQKFLKGVADATDGRAIDINETLGNLQPVAEQTTDLLSTLDRQSAVVRQLTSDTGTVFNALGERQGELQGLIRAGDRVLASTARRNGDLAETVRILPTTMRELRPTLADLDGLVDDATPVVRDLRPAARALGPTLEDAVALAPELEGLFRDVDRVIDIADSALPATTEFVDSAVPLFKLLTPTLQEAKPVVDFLGPYKREFTQMWANIASATQGTELSANGERLHYLRALVPFTFEGLVTNDQRFGSNRHNPYFEPGGLAKLPDGLESISCENAGNFTPPGQNAPPCKVQKPQTFQGRTGAYPQVKAEK